MDQDLVATLMASVQGMIDEAVRAERVRLARMLREVPTVREMVRENPSDLWATQEAGQDAATMLVRLAEALEAE